MAIIYVCSDLHGRYDRWIGLIEKIGLRPDDTLYVLGDMIDRGPDGCKILLDMMSRSNVIPILGNHELTAAICLPWLLKEISDHSLNHLDDSRIASLQEWMMSGGDSTLKELKQLTKAERESILDYLREMELYAEVEAGGRKFVLSHAGLDHFAPHKSLEDYELEDFLFCRPRLNEKFWPDRYLVYGHTPTRLLRAQIGQPLSDDILCCGQQIAIDCACGFDGKLGCIRLDTMEEFYVE